MNQQLLHPWDSPIGVPCLSCDAAGCEHCGFAGVAYDIARAEAPRNEIIPRLWQGGHSCASCLRCETWPTGFDIVIDMRRTDLGAPPAGYEKTTRRLQYAIPDSVLTPAAHAAALDASRQAREVHDAGGTVLIRCHWGLNRSSLVTGLTLTALGHAGDAAVGVIRAQRSPWSLCNRDYEKAVRESRY